MNTRRGAEEANRESSAAGTSRDLQEMKDRLRRMETRLVTLCTNLGYETVRKKPAFKAGQLEVPSMQVSLEDMLTALPHDWDGEVVVWHKGICVSRFRFPPRVS